LDHLGGLSVVPRCRFRRAVRQSVDEPSEGPAAHTTAQRTYRSVHSPPGRHDGEWLPLVDTTDSPLLWLIHQGVPYSKVAHVNEDGTVLITDNAAGNTRAIRQAEQGLHGLPPP
jgi:hypothetical protein